MLPRDAQLLMHIQDYCVDIENYLTDIGHSYDTFLTDTMIQHAISFCILQIGELVGKLSSELRTLTENEINWVAIKGMRNIVVHDYGNVDLNEVWIAAANDTPVLKSFCEKQLTAT